MIKLTEIKEAVLKKLSNELEGFQFFEDETDSSFDKPSFVVEVIPISSIRSGRYFNTKKLTINIKYFCKNGTNSEIIEMTDKLNEVFKNDLYVNDEHFTIEKKEFSIEKKVLNYKIPLEFDDVVEEKECIPITDLDEELGYTKETIKTMNELKMKGDY